MSEPTKLQTLLVQAAWIAFNALFFLGVAFIAYGFWLLVWSL